MPVPTSDLVAAMLVVAVAGFFQGIVGMGFNVLAVPIMLLINPLLAPAPNLILAVPLTISQVIRERSAVDTKGVVWILAGRLPGAVIGLGLLVVLATRVVDITLALLILIAVAALGSGRTIRRTRRTEFAAGVVSGIGGIVGAVGGPPIGLLYRDAPGPLMRSSLAVVFSIGLIASIGLRVAGGQMTLDDLRIGLGLVPAMGVGFAASSRFRDRFEGAGIRRGILAISALAGSTLLIRSLLP